MSRAAEAAMALALIAVRAVAAPEGPAERFFMMGSGTLAIRNAHSGERADVRYRRDDGSYDPAALTALARLFRSRSDKAEHDVSLRLVEILSMIRQRAGAKELVLVSGYRSPVFNEQLRSEGRKAAGGSLHTEAIAADFSIPGVKLRPLWDQLRALDCCGVGLYEKDGFLHVDVGRPRFWEPATSRVDENLSAGNARVFARTEYDRYAAGEPIELRVHSITVPPLAVEPGARLIDDHGQASAVEVAALARPAAAAGEGERPRCIEVARDQNLVVRGAPATARGRIELRTCEPRAEQTPATIESNAIEIVEIR